MEVRPEGVLQADAHQAPEAGLHLGLHGGQLLGGSLKHSQSDTWRDLMGAAVLAFFWPHETTVISDLLKLTNRVSHREHVN